MQVSPIVEDVRARGDEAVKEYTAKFDRVQLDAVCVPIEVRPHAGFALVLSKGLFPSFFST